MRWKLPLLSCALAFAFAALSTALRPAMAQVERASASQLAADRGCYNCHSEPSRKSARSFAEIRKAYATQRGRPGAERQAVERMHHGSLFSHVAAHESLSDEDAELIVHWLFSGTP